MFLFASSLKSEGKNKKSKAQSLKGKRSFISERLLLVGSRKWLNDKNKKDDAEVSETAEVAEGECQYRLISKS